MGTVLCLCRQRGTSIAGKPRQFGTCIVTTLLKDTSSLQKQLRWRNSEHQWLHGAHSSDGYGNRDVFVATAPFNRNKIWAHATVIEPSQEPNASQTLEPVPDPIIKGPRLNVDGRRFIVQQQWEGIVLRLYDNSFEAELRDLTNFKNALEITELPLTEISETDRHLIRPGCVFYWVLGHETRNHGQISNVSEIRVRRMPNWEKADIEQLHRSGDSLFKQFNEDATQND